MIADRISVYAENGVSGVAFATGDKSIQYVMIQKTDHPSGQDIVLGQSGVYFEINDQIQGGYDLVRSFLVKDGRLQIELENCEYDSVFVLADTNSDAFRNAAKTLRGFATKAGIEYVEQFR
jgi:hypothetical protein